MNSPFKSKSNKFDEKAMILSWAFWRAIKENLKNLIKKKNSREKFTEENFLKITILEERG